MNLFVTTIFAVCYGIAQFAPTGELEDWAFRLPLILWATLIAPLTAIAQTRVVADRLRRSRDSWERQNAIVGRLSRQHCTVWAVAGFYIFVWLDWPAVVAVTWQLDKVPVLYEVILLSPLVLSLIGSWFAFFDIQQFYGRSSRRWSILWHKRWAFVSLRIRAHLIATIVPLVLLLTGMRYSYLLQNLTVPQIVLAVAMLGLWASAIMPLIFLMVWDTQPIVDVQLRRDLEKVCRLSGVAVTRMRVWRTSNQIANAAVTGLLPGFRIVLLTDALLKYFTREEVAVVVRHEAGHVKLLHLPLKVFFVILPMVALIFDRTHSLGVHYWIESAVGESGVLNLPCAAISQGAIAVIFVGYLFFVMRWLNHRLEHEADLFAVMELGSRNASNDNDNAAASANAITALKKLAAIAPQQLDRATFMHPSIAARIGLLESVAADRRIAKEFQLSFRRRNVMILIPWIALLGIALVAYSTISP